MLLQDTNILNQYSTQSYQVIFVITARNIYLLILKFSTTCQE